MLYRDLTRELERRRAAHLYRQRRRIEAAPGPHLTLDGRPAIAFCTNDYLGLARHPEVIAACQRGAADYGVGSGSAHLVAGHGPAHQALEEELADFLGRERALLFSTGYMANLGLLQALAGPGETVFEDRLNHASLIDGALLARARPRRYPHCDMAALRRQLAACAHSHSHSHSESESGSGSSSGFGCESRSESGSRSDARSRLASDSWPDVAPPATGRPVALIATDGVFSMDGDL
ncbi:MAG TPA: aminotransferase class I/II-fold pyridoxal phosphate-dependent enzyme, partial [Chromatiaceae bacterium]|nr:aminotransferase class I/II-fold pyridoxal phosphate-dependent enzyme [Chromatiaceae bacterium]